MALPDVRTFVEVYAYEIGLFLLTSSDLTSGRIPLSSLIRHCPTLSVTETRQFFFYLPFLGALIFSNVTFHTPHSYTSFIDPNLYLPYTCKVIYKF